MPRLSLALQALRELGPAQLALYAAYQLGKRTGWWRLRTPTPKAGYWPLDLRQTPAPPDSASLKDFLGPAATALPALAAEISAGRVPLFGRAPVPLQFPAPAPLRHWTAHEEGPFAGRDAKFTWEPARFGWALALARAGRLTGQPRFAAALHAHTRAFLAANPPYLGPNWASGQEVGLRLIALVIAWRALSPPGEPDPGALLAAHAKRIPPTLLYARAQNNNHLLTEAAALYTAGLVLPSHPQAASWRALGWRWFHHGVRTQFDADGAYSQHSANYHRLALHAALWVWALAQCAGETFPPESQARLAAATRWLHTLCVPGTGRAPNLGPNDGAHILPLTALPFEDYRPVLQAAGRAFLGAPLFPPGPWDELGAWLGLPPSPSTSAAAPPPAPAFTRSPATLSAPPHWAYLRAAHFSARPGHADQLHLDLWWRGLNVAQDPGTYLYNAPPPWDNALSAAAFHNTLTVDGLDQMARAGRFLYVHRAQGRLLEAGPGRLVGEHDGYRALGLTHRRTVEATPTGWRVTDELLAAAPARHTGRLHWLLPDWPWQLAETDPAAPALHLESPFGPVVVRVHAPQREAVVRSQLHCGRRRALARAGEALRGVETPAPAAGWVSPTYGVKEPALSFSVTAEGPLPLRWTTEWIFPPEGR